MKETIKSIEEYSDKLAELVPGLNTILGVSDVQSLLDEETTLLSYYSMDSQTLTFLITHDSFQIIDINISRKELFTQTQALTEFPNLHVSHLDSAVYLYDSLFEPLKKYISSRHIIIIPHGVLHYLPFAALTDGKRFLIDDYVLTVIPSASSLPFILNNTTERNIDSLLILGNPKLDNINFPQLSFAEQESQTIADLYGVKPLLGETATESIIWEQASQAGILHLAAHGSYNRTNPLFSAIFLTPSSQGDDKRYDGILEAREVYSLDLSQTNLVVLSACETNISELDDQQLVVSAGDELIGLTRAFFFAGTPSIVSSLWSVDDETTSILMKRFYQHLREGMSKAEALRQAQIEVREEYPSPYYWSGFVLSGDDGR